MEMKKRLFSILVVLVMVMCLAPATVLADTYHCGCGADLTEEDLTYVQGNNSQQVHEVRHKETLCYRLIKTENHTWNKEDGTCTKCKRTCYHFNGNDDHYCDTCGKQITAHTGGTATCTKKATCSTCGEEYGELSSDSHIGTLVWNKTATTHKQVYSECGHEQTGTEGNHTFKNGVCTVCDYECDHTDEGTEWIKTSDTKHQEVYKICGAVKSEGDHTGGTATCIEQATCDICHEKYGELNSHELTHVDAKAATVAEVGNEEYWVCNVCNKYFGDADATDEIESSKTVIAKLAPTIINSDGQTVTVSEKAALTFTSDAPFEDFIRVELDGKIVDSSNYTVKSGSTIVTLNADYVATLATGEHTLGIVSQGGTATEKFTITQKATETTTTTAKDETTTTTVKAETTATTTSAKTGDNSNLGLWITLLCVSGGAVTVTALVSKKKNYNR